MSFFVMNSGIEELAEVRVATRGNHRLEQQCIGGGLALEQMSAKGFENVSGTGLGPGCQEVGHLLNKHDIKGIEQELLLPSQRL